MHIQDDKPLARQEPEIDRILGGHDHEPYTMYEGRTLIHKSGQNAFWLAKLEFELNRSGAHPDRPQWSMIVNQHIRDEPTCEHIVVKYLRQLSAMENSDEAKRGLATVAEYPLSSERMYAVVNGGFIRGDSVYEVGEDITVGTLDHEMPFPRPAVVVRILARDFLEALEQQFAWFPQVSSSHPHISGLYITFDRTSKRVVTLQDTQTQEPLDLETAHHRRDDRLCGPWRTAWKRGEIVETNHRVAVGRGAVS